MTTIEALKKLYLKMTGNAALYEGTENINNIIQGDTIAELIKDIAEVAIPAEQAKFNDSDLSVALEKDPNDPKSLILHADIDLKNNYAYVFALYGHKSGDDRKDFMPNRYQKLVPKDIEEIRWFSWNTDKNEMKVQAPPFECIEVHAYVCALDRNFIAMNAGKTVLNLAEPV